MTRNLVAVARVVEGRLIGSDAPFATVTTDTRTLEPGALFVAIRGEHFDGNDFLSDAATKGAAGALVSRPADVELSQIAVADTREAFGSMAKAWRENFAIPVIAVTGSAGKTTVKELIAGILARDHRVCVTQGNLNNDIGVPLTLMRLDESHDALVVELGANHAGEIAYLAGLVRPTVAVITNAGAAHLAGFGSLRGVADAKGELLDELPLAGTAVLNADDPFFADWHARSTAAATVGFGTAGTADCCVLGDVDMDEGSSRFTIRLPDGDTIAVALPLPGMANVMNALAAAAAAHAAGAKPEAIAAGLARAAPVEGRLATRPGRNGAVIIDDSYNANPSSAKAALDYLSRLPGRRVCVLGDMLELGPAAAALHAEVGRYAVGRCDLLIGFGELASAAAGSFGQPSRHYTEIDALNAAVSAELAPNVTVLVKGSRSMGLERLVAALVDERSDRRC
jgi:UDP-N-acetylmuramoyl-tripeptide--D-alanyl-D-alanine ligase